MQKWEYTQIQNKDGQVFSVKDPVNNLGLLDENLTRLGQDGWELVNVHVSPQWKTELYTFKRPLR